MSRALPTTANSNDPFFVHRPDTKINPLVVDILEGAEAPAFGAAKRGSYVQAIPSFLQAPHQPMAVNIQVRMYEDNQLNQMMQSVIIKSSLFLFFFILSKFIHVVL